MSYSKAAEEARIIVNLDFSLVVPGGTLYQTGEEQLPQEVPELEKGARLALDLTAPRTVRTGADFSDPIARGVIRNYTAGLFIDHYGTDVKQETAVASRNAMAIYGVKTTADGACYLVIVTERGLYEGRAVMAARSARERLKIVKEVLASLTRYDSTQAEIDAVKTRAEKAQKEAERQRRLKAEAEQAAAARQEAARAQAAREEAGSGPALRQEGAPEQAAAEESGKTGPESASQTAGSASAQEQRNVAAVTDEAAADEERRNGEEPGEPEPGNTAADTETKPDSAAAGKETQATEEEKRIEELETKRKAHLDELRAKFAGNPQVEAGIDNYIARVDHTGDEVVAAFRKFLRGVQEYASSTSFTSENDPNYVNMLQSVRDEETSLGRKLDDLVRSVDVNMNDAVEAGVTEAYVERMIRMTERLGAKYDKLAVAMNGRDRIAYMMPGEVRATILKWQKFRENLPSQLEETDRRRELETSNRIQAEILEKRTALAGRQAAAEAAEQAFRDIEQAAAGQQKAADEFETSYEEKKEQIEKLRDEQLAANREAVSALEKDLEDDRKDVDELQEELSHTFALNVNKKKLLTSRIDEFNSRISEEEERLMQLRDAASGFETEADKQLSALEEERERLQTAAAAAQQEHEEKETAYHTAAEAFRQLKEDLAAEEEEWKHVHEYYLAGRYDK